MPAAPSVAVRLEPVVREGGEQVVAAEVAGVGAKPYRLWYRLPADVAVDELSRAHAFTVSVLHQAMAVGRDVEIDGPLTRGLLQNLEDYQRVWSTWEPRRFRTVGIRPTALLDDEPYRPGKGALLGFSGGLDSAHAALCLSRSGDLAGLVTIRGLDLAIDDEARFQGALAHVRPLAASLGRPLRLAATNWEAVMPALPGYVGYFIPTVAVQLLTSAGYGWIAAPSVYSYDRFAPSIENNALTDPLLGRPGLPIRHFGAWARRIDKVAAVAAWPEALEHLRPCDLALPDGRACTTCRKCVQTALLFLGLGLPVPRALGGRPPATEAVERFEMPPYALLALVDAADAARARGVDDPWVEVAERRIASYGADPAAVGEVAILKRRLRFLLGGSARPGLARTLRRVGRALRGRTGPPDLPPLASGPARPSGRAHARVEADAPLFATSARGRRLYVDRDDGRGTALVAKHGALDPTTLRIWQGLLRARPWTHVVDVGANYGEMLVDLEGAPGVAVFAVEPNPRVRRLLERSLREAGVPATIVPKAISDAQGRLPLSIDRTWSGMSAVHADPRETAGHRIETIEVETTTLRALLDDGTPDGAKRVLLKVDVEGHEPSVLRGLERAGLGYGELAALVEIRHLGATDLSLFLRSFDLELYDPRADTFTRFGVGGLDALLEALEGGRFHREDAVLRPRASAVPA